MSRLAVSNKKVAGLSVTIIILLVVGLLLWLMYPGGGSSLTIQAASGNNDVATRITQERANRPSPASIGAYFVLDYASIQAADFESSVPEQTAGDAALDFFRDGFDIPRGVGLQEGVVIRSTTARFSGAKHGSGEWTIADRPVWIVVLDEIPVSLPCGPPRAGGCPVHSPRFNVAIDAETGEILTSELTGAGPSRPKWHDTKLANPVVNPPEPSPPPN